VNTRYETDHDLRDLQNSEEPDREISLGATTILGIFFALALLCAVFFGFGYSQGRRSVPPAAAPTESTMAPENNAAKPAPGSVANQHTSPDKQSVAPADTAVVPLTQPSNPPQDDQPASEPARAAVADPRPVSAKPTASAAIKQPAPIPTPVATSSPGSSVVQVAAMSHQEDADVVALDLKRRGYPVAVRRVPQDKLFHVQIGPYATKKDADVMRQHLQADGYNNAIVK
jgi:DedD protein